MTALHSIIVELRKSAILLIGMKVYSHPSLSKVSLASAMQALSDPCRIAIVRALLRATRHEFACNEIPLRVSKATRSHHFEVLREAGLIFTRPNGVRCMTSLRLAEFNARFPGLLDLVGTTKRVPKKAKPGKSLLMSVG
jgi:DNA-binding transcriptional ArsR family regulator